MEIMERRLNRNSGYVRELKADTKVPLRCVARFQMTNKNTGFYGASLAVAAHDDDGGACGVDDRLSGGLIHVRSR